MTDLSDFGLEQLKDDVLLFYRNSELYCRGSQEAEDLCDEIQRAEIAVHYYAELFQSSANERDRSTTVIEALKFFRDYRESQLEHFQFEAGEI